MKLTEKNLCGLRSLGCIRVEESHEVVLDGILDEGAAVTDERDTEDNGEERKPSVGWSAEGVKEGGSGGMNRTDIAKDGGEGRRR
jgi:hypothetical protein